MEGRERRNWSIIEIAFKNILIVFVFCNFFFHYSISLIIYCDFYCFQLFNMAKVKHAERLRGGDNSVRSSTELGTNKCYGNFKCEFYLWHMKIYQMKIVIINLYFHDFSLCDFHICCRLELLILYFHAIFIKHASIPIKHFLRN